MFSNSYNYTKLANFLTFSDEKGCPTNPLIILVKFLYSLSQGLLDYGSFNSLLMWVSSKQFSSLP